MLKTPRPQTSFPRTRSDRRAALAELEGLIEHASHLLPAQGPITVFIHHNTLHAFEDLPFDQALKQASLTYGCQPYLTENQYRDALRTGRIRFAELTQVLQRDLGASASDAVPCFGTRLDLRLAMLNDPLCMGPATELIWYVEETNALQRMRPEASSATRSRLIAETRHWVMRDLRGDDDAQLGSKKTRAAGASNGLRDLLDRFGESTIERWSDQQWERFTLQALWRVCRDGVRDVQVPTANPHVPIRHRDLLLDATDEDADLLVHGALIPFVAAYLDQGMAQHTMPLREEGFLRAFGALYGRQAGSPDRWKRGLAEELQRMEQKGVTPIESILDSLEKLGVPPEEWNEFISASLLALRGWAGMVRQLELRGDRAVHPLPANSLLEFLAVRLLLDRFAASHVAREAIGYDGPLHELRDELHEKYHPRRQPTGEQRAFLIFQLAQVVGVAPNVLHQLTRKEWGCIVQEIEAFDALERRRIFQLAYERRFVVQALDSIAIHSSQKRERSAPPVYQVACCLDEREESFRRHLEEIEPRVETFGAAGFYNVAMYYRGAADAHFTPLCPVVVRPKHWVIEEVADDHRDTHQRRAKTRRALGAAVHHIHRGSRTIASGTVLAGTVGVLATFPLVARILFPRLAARIRKSLGHIVEPPTATRLRIERHAETCGPEADQVGFTVDEMAAAAEGLLRGMGLTTRFSRLVLLLGHGSSSLNNPYNSAYNCGACGGSAGGPNARAMAHLLNDPRVRASLTARGLPIPSDTVFVGGYHNTCDETVTYFDLDGIPESHRAEFALAQRDIENACDRNAHERCRRFMSAPLSFTPPAARRHVAERAEDLAQTRPELGHATNALTFVGRRDWSRGLFLDRRAFLTSYDPTQDDANSSILTGLLQAVFPVCAGINLEYYFSKVDNAGFGSGTKLPHNLASLLGVMDGAASDLRTGLPWQMVEIHEPMRSLFVIETTPEAMLGIMDRNEAIGRLSRNGWIQLAVLHPETRELSLLHDGKFEPYRPQVSTLPEAARSIDWYRGWRDHLEFCQIASRAG